MKQCSALLNFCFRCCLVGRYSCGSLLHLPVRGGGLPLGPEGDLALRPQCLVGLCPHCGSDRPAHCLSVWSESFAAKRKEKNGLGESRGVEIKKDFCFKTGKISMQQVAEGKNWWSGERSRSFWNTVTGWEGLGFCARRPHVSSGLPGWAVGSVFPGVGTRVVLSLENFKAVTTFKCWPAFLLFHVPEPESLILNSISDKNVACGRPGGSVD